jgi:hypothetical protein
MGTLGIAYPAGALSPPQMSLVNDVMTIVLDRGKEQATAEVDALLHEANKSITSSPESATSAEEAPASVAAGDPGCIDVTGMTDDDRERLGLPPGTNPARQAQRRAEKSRGHAIMGGGS